MMFPPSAPLWLLSEPPEIRPVYDNPPMIVIAPRRRRLRGVLSRPVRVEPQTEPCTPKKAPSRFELL